VSNDILDPFCSLLTGISLLYHLKVACPFDIVDALLEKDLISRGAATNLIDALNRLYCLKIKCQLFYMEDCDFVFPQSLQENAKKQMYLNGEDISNLERIFRVQIGLYSACSLIREADTPPTEMKLETFFDPTPIPEIKACFWSGRYLTTQIDFPKLKDLGNGRYLALYAILSSARLSRSEEREVKNILVGEKNLHRSHLFH